MMEVILKICVLIYDFALLAGAAYLVEERNWSMWTFLLVTVFFFLPKSKTNVKEEK